MIFVTTKMVGQQKIFSPPLLVLLLDSGSGSGMDKNQDPG